MANSKITRLQPCVTKGIKLCMEVYVCTGICCLGSKGFIIMYSISHTAHLRTMYPCLFMHGVWKDSIPFTTVGYSKNSVVYCIVRLLSSLYTVAALLTMGQAGISKVQLPFGCGSKLTFLCRQQVERVLLTLQSHGKLRLHYIL